VPCLRRLFNRKKGLQLGNWCSATSMDVLAMLLSGS